MSTHTITPTPSGRVATCRRYRSDGERCRTATSYADGWCRTCDGLPAPPSPQPTLTPFQYKRQVPLDQVPPIDPATIAIADTALDAYQDVHHGTRERADAHIRDLLRDVIRDGRATTGSDGQFALVTTGRLRGYSLIISARGDAVLGYATRYATRTYEQLRARVGVTRRPKHKGQSADRARYAAWQLAMRVVLDRHDPAVVEAEVDAHADPRVRTLFDRYRARLADKTQDRPDNDE
ncbi:hypothetical protein ACQEVF_57770 [Nonomuraea polychroma]|uniref:hypothetical protein n=1 Tax=Nonomuraea polychroma TaxID=46176 RepID=UPI003D93C5C3